MNKPNQKTQSDPPQGRVNPRISINKLGEYLTASAARRRKIITDQKYPPDAFITAGYKEVFDATVNFFTRDALDPKGVLTAIERLQKKQTFNAQQETGRKNNILALRRLLQVVNDIPFVGMTFRAVPNNVEHLSIGGVSVSVRPELEIVATQRGGVVKYGLLKLYLGKTHPFTERAGELVATTVHQFAEQYFGNAGAVDQRHCFVLDVFQKRLFTTPQSIIRRREEVTANCEEIAARWPTL